jgi:hypothetical protein
MRPTLFVCLTRKRLLVPETEPTSFHFNPGTFEGPTKCKNRFYKLYCHLIR